MSRLVYAEDVKREIDKWLDVVGDATIGKGLSYYGELLGCIEDAPTIEAKEVVHGEWVKEENTWVCSVCHKENACAYSEELERYIDFYCPKCGARMDGAE